MKNLSKTLSKLLSIEYLKNENGIKEATYIKRPRNTTRELYRLQILNQIYGQEISICEKIKTLSNTHFIGSMLQTNETSLEALKKLFKI